MNTFSKNIIVLYRIVFVSICMLFSLPLSAQEENSLASLNNDPVIVKESQEIRKLRLVVEANLGDLEAHEAYLKAVRKSRNPYKSANYNDLEDQYSKWMAEMPSNSVIPYAIGSFYYQMERPEAKQYLLMATTIKPQFAKAWYMLGIDAMRLGNKEMIVTYLSNAAKAEPENDNYAFSYAYNAQELSIEKSDSLLQKVAENNVNKEGGAKALYFLAERENDPDKKLKYFEQLNTKFSKEGGSWYRRGMSNYFSLLINKGAYQNALMVAGDMDTGVVENKLEWKHKIQVAKQFLQLAELNKAKRYLEALKLIGEIKLRNDFSVSYVAAAETLQEIKNTILTATGNSSSVLETLLKRYTLNPSYKLRDQINSLALRLDVDTASLYQSVLDKWLANREEATSFTLENFRGDKVSLADYKGKLVLISYWFPGCGPCRAEFPHLENVLKKFDSQDIAYLGINAMPEQDPYVLPFMESTGFSFTPLRIDLAWDPGNLSASAYPKNYLIDQEGKIVWSGFIIGEQNEEMLELKIKAFLAAK